MDAAELRAQIGDAPIAFRAALQRMLLYATAGDGFLPAFEDHGRRSSTYQGFFDAIFADESQKDTLLWAECARLNQRDWLGFFEPKLVVRKLRLKTDGLPIQMGSGVVLAPTGSRDNIADLYVFENGGFNRQAADFVTSLAGRFKMADYSFLGIYGLYKHRGNVILEEWDIEREPVYEPER